MSTRQGYLQVGSRAVDRRGKNEQDLEQVADGVLSQADGSVPTYTEKQLARKIRLEDRRMPVVAEAGIPQQAMDYLLASQLRLMVETAKLTKLQASVLGFAMMGWTAKEIAWRFGIGLFRVKRALRIARRKTARGGSPYDGLYEVYWSEVHRYTYRKRG